LSVIRSLGPPDPVDDRLRDGGSQKGAVFPERDRRLEADAGVDQRGAAVTERRAAAT
jgi:hypothetical protein